MQALVNNRANPIDPEHPFPGVPASTRPERESGYTDYYGLDGREYVPFILRELLFDFIPALQGGTRHPWYIFANLTPSLWTGVMLLLMLLRLDFLRWTEYLSISALSLAHSTTRFRALDLLKHSRTRSSSFLRFAFSCLFLVSDPVGAVRR